MHGKEVFMASGSVRAKVLALALGVSVGVSLVPREAMAQWGSLSSFSMGSTSGWITIGAVLALGTTVAPIAGNAHNVWISQRSVGWAVTGLALGTLNAAAVVGLTAASLPSRGNEASTTLVATLGCAAAATITLSVINLLQPTRPRWRPVRVAPVVFLSPSGASLELAFATHAF